MGTNEIKLNIGMSMTEVKALANDTKPLNENTKRLIFEFCHNDFDQKITDDIELHMLNTWLSNKNRIWMPKYEREGFIEKHEKNLMAMTGENRVYKVSGTEESLPSRNYSTILTTGIFNSEATTQSTLYDTNKDGLADTYETGILQKGDDNWKWKTQVLNRTTRSPNSFMHLVK